MNSTQHALAVLALAVCQAAVAQAPVAPIPSAATMSTDGSNPASGATELVKPSPDAKNSELSNDSARSVEPQIMRGTDRVVAPAVAIAPPTGTPVEFNFEETPVADVVRIVLGDVLRADYVLYPPIVGTVTMSTRQAVMPDQAVYLLESALQANGLVLVRDARGTYHVGRPDALKALATNVRQAVVGSPLPAGYGVIIVPLQFIGVAEMATILRPLMPADALIRADAARNMLVLVGTRSQAEGWLDMVRTFDVDLLKGMSVGMFPLKYASVKEVETALRLMSAGVSSGGSAAAGAAAAAPANARASAAAAPAEPNPLLGALRILPIERLNSILVVTPRAAYLDEVRRWIERFDRPNDNTAEAQLFVYPVQNGSAQHLANVLGGIFGTGQATPTASSAGTGVAPRLGQTTATTAATPFATGAASGFGFQNNSQTPANQPLNRPAVPAVTPVDINNGVRVVADELNNAVLIYGTRADYRRIEAALKRLDAPVTQILIEASIVEVTLNDDLKFGVQWMFGDKERGGLSGTGVLSGSPGGVLGAAQAGFSYTLRNPLGNVRAVLNALSGKTRLNVISSPSLMVLDNHTANINVGTQQPINTGTTIGVGGVTSTNIQYKDTGVSLAVTPSANSSDMVTMQINQAVTDVGAADSSTGQVTFLQRQINSKVAVRSGETLVLGGLIRDTSTASKNGVPGLSDLPLIGALFGTKSKNADRTELLVVITPRVIRSDQGLRDVSQELRERMRGLGFNASRTEAGTNSLQPIN